MENKRFSIKDRIYSFKYAGRGVVRLVSREHNAWIHCAVAIEALCDKVSPEYDEAIKHTKDLAAGAVLILAVMSIIVGLLIFVPKILSLFY